MRELLRISLNVKTTRWRGSRRNTVKAGLNIALASCAYKLIGDLPVMEEQKGGNGSNTVFGGEGLLLVNVDFADFDASVEFIRQFVEHRRDHFAWTAPLGPKINEHGNG